MGSLSILALDGQHEFYSTNRINSKFGNHNQRIFIWNFCGRIKIGRTKCIPSYAQMTMAMNNEYKTEFAPEHNQFLVGEYKSKSVDTRKGGN